MGGVDADGLGTEDPLIAEFLRLREDLFSYDDRTLCRRRPFEFWAVCRAAER